MDPIRNPYSPGAGSPPPELAGRNALRAQLAIALARIRRGNQAKSVLMVGLRGVGKTVLLDQIRKDAEEKGIYALRIEAPENKSLPALLAPQLRRGSESWCSTRSPRIGRVRESSEGVIQRH
jgi:Cdc6-like AAA superfamily ATPase